MFKCTSADFHVTLEFFFKDIGSGWRVRVCSPFLFDRYEGERTPQNSDQTWDNSDAPLYAVDGPCLRERKMQISRRKKDEIG